MQVQLTMSCLLKHAKTMASPGDSFSRVGHLSRTSQVPPFVAWTAWCCQCRFHSCTALLIPPFCAQLLPVGINSSKRHLLSKPGFNGYISSRLNCVITSISRRMARKTFTEVIPRASLPSSAYVCDVSAASRAVSSVPKVNLGRGEWGDWLKVWKYVECQWMLTMMYLFKLYYNSRVVRSNLVFSAVKKTAKSWNYQNSYWVVRSFLMATKATLYKRKTQFSSTTLDDIIEILGPFTM